MGFDFNYMIFMMKEVLVKFPVNLQLVVVAFLSGLLFALIITIIRYYRITLIIALIEIYLSLARGTPIILQIILFFLGLPILFVWLARLMDLDFTVRDFPPMLSATVALTFYITAPLSETLRGGVSGIKKGEIEAGYSIGMTAYQILKRIIIPQSFTLCLPNFCVLFIGLAHSTTLVFGATLIEMNGQAGLLADDYGFYFEAYLTIGLFFWLITLILQKLFGFLEKKLRFGPSRVYT